MTPKHEEAAKRIAHAILDRSTEGTATRVALKQAIAGGGERDLGGLNAIALAEVISEQLAALIADVRRQAMESQLRWCLKVLAMVPQKIPGQTRQETAMGVIRARLEEGK